MEYWLLVKITLGALKNRNAQVNWNFQFKRYQRYMNTPVYMCISNFTYASGIDRMLISAMEGSKLERGLGNGCVCFLDRLQVKTR